MSDKILNKKYSLLLLMLITGFLMGCSTINKTSKDLEKDITMFVATDIHYLAKDLYVNGNAFQNYLDTSDGKLIHYIDEIMLAFTNDIANKKPDILIISGDLTNNGEKESHVKLAERLDEIEQQTGTRICVIPGNHDLLNPWARGFSETEQYITDTIGPDDFVKIYNSFGYEEAISRDESSLSYLVAPSDDLWLLMLDSCIYDFNELMGAPTTNGEITSDTFEWIKKCSELAKEKNAQIVTVMHHNLFNHSEILNSGFTLDNNEEALKIYQESGFPLVLSGHIHIQDIRSSGVEGNNIVYDIATGALSVYPVQYGVLKFDPLHGFDYNTSKVDVENWAKESGRKDENLIHFEEYAKEYFSDISYNQAYDTLTKVGNNSKQEKELMAKTMSLINIHYFGGTVDSIKDEVLESEGYHLWQSVKEPEFLREYILSILEDSNANKIELQIPLPE
jgi:3',5'-cyclic AMP phosphodiesterase CpdA